MAYLLLVVNYIIINLFGNTVLLLLLRSYMMVCGLLLLPCSFLKNLHHVSSLSFWNGIVHVVINAIILGYCLLRYKEINIVKSELVQINRIFDEH